MSTLPKEVPQGSGEVGVDGPLHPHEQMDLLWKKLAGNKAFEACRGRFGYLPQREFLDGKKGEIPSPTSVIKKFDDWVGHHRVMLNLLAVLSRDGHSIAFEQLSNALSNPRFTMLGETVRMELTEPSVLVIPNLERTLSILRELYASRGIEHPPTSPSIHLFPQNEPVYKKLRKVFFRKVRCMWEDESIVGHRFLHNYPFGFFVIGADQAKVLSVFSRDEQECLSTWRFDYPKVNYEDFGDDREVASREPDSWIGFHPEEEHQQWRKQWPSYASRGCSHGVGTLILDQKRFAGVGIDSDGLHRYDIIGDPPHPKGGVKSKRVVLRFPA